MSEESIPSTFHIGGEADDRVHYGAEKLDDTQPAQIYCSTCRY